MRFTLETILVAAVTVGGMLACFAIGRRLGKRWRVPAGPDDGTGAIDAAVFALLGLLVGFTFSGALGRFDNRRALIVTEANAIGTAYLRVDLLPAHVQPELRVLFRRYVESRLAAYGKLPDVDAAMAELRRSTALQQEIWTRAVSAARAVENPAVLTLVGSALNQMIDITTARLAATRFHSPPGIFTLLAALALASSLVAGYSMHGDLRRNGLHVGTFAVVFAASIFVILDLEYPRLGLIRVDDADRLLVEVLQSMK